MKERRVDHRTEGRSALVVRARVEGTQCVAFEQNASPEIAKSCRGGRAAVAGDRVRTRHHFAARRPQPPTQIHVFEVRKQLAIETAAAHPVVTADGHVAAAGEGHRLPCRWKNSLRRREALTGLKRVAVEGHHAAHEVMSLPVPGREPAGARRSVWMRRQRLEVGLDDIVLHRRVVVEKDQDVTRRRSSAEVDTTREPGVCVRSHHPHPWETAGRVVAAAV